MRIGLDKLTIDPEIQIRHGIREETIQRYMEVLDELPAIKGVRLKNGHVLLADGFHRVEAAKRLGRRSLPIGVIDGTREMALDIAAEANTEHGAPLTREERDDGIRRLKANHPEWNGDIIAKHMHCGSSTVSTVLARDNVRAEIGDRAGLTDKHYSELAKLPVGQWNETADIIQQRRWDTHTAELMIRNLRDDRLPQDFRERLRRGEEDPVIVNRDGTFSLPMSAVVRQVQQATSNDPALVLEQALLMLARLRQFKWPDIHQSLDAVRRERLRSEMPGYIAFLEDGLKPQFQIIEGNTKHRG